MAKKKRKKTASRPKQGKITIRTGKASDHPALVNDLVHVFVDDQNLFYGITNDKYGPGFRVDFGRLLLEASKGSDGRTRGIASAYIAGVIPDDDSFWKAAEDKGFTVHRGYLGQGNRSKQDDAYLITYMTKTIYTTPGPSTIILVAGDADYMPPLENALSEGWRTEVAFIDRGVSIALEPHLHEIRIMPPTAIERL